MSAQPEQPERPPIEDYRENQKAAVPVPVREEYAADDEAGEVAPLDDEQQQ